MPNLKNQWQVKRLWLFALTLLLLSGLYGTMPQAQAHDSCREASCLPVTAHMLPQPITITRQPTTRQAQDLVISQVAVAFDEELQQEYVLTARNPALIGRTVTYTVIITNVSDHDIFGLVIADVLPRNAFDKWNFTTCPDEDRCTLSPISPTLSSTPPRQISWTLDRLAKQGEFGDSKRYTFSGRLVCRPDESILSNEVFVSYEGNNQNNILENVVSAAVFQTRGSLTLAGPTWCSFEAQGATDLDWGDFDLDGDLDLALATETDIVVYKNNHGLLESFWHGQIATSGVRWADVSSSSPGLELVTVGTSNDIYQFVGTEFSKLQSFTSDSGLSRLEMADYNGDGFMDIAGLVPFGESCLVQIYRNDGWGNFDNEGCILQSQTNSYAQTLAWGDFDKVNGADLAVAGYKFVGDEIVLTLSLIVNRGDGSFDAPKSLINSVFDTTFALNWGDYDGNGYLDLVVPLYQSDKIWLFWNDNGQLSSTNVTEIDIPQPSSVEGADFDHDGVLDLAVASDNNNNGTLTVFTVGTNDDRQFYQIGDTYSMGQREASIWTTRSADVDNDGDMDIAIAIQGESVLFSNLGIFLEREAQFVDEQSFASANSVIWGDMDSDKKLDLLLGAGSDNNALGTALYENQQGQFSLQQQFPGLGPRQVALGDYNNDGRLDLAVVDNIHSDIYLNGQGNTSIWRENIAGGRSVAWGDANDDGYLDLLIGVDGYSKLIFNQFNATSSNPLTNLVIPTGYNAVSVAWGDYNRDRYLDFAIANSNGPTQIYCNNRDNTFQLAWTSTFTKTIGKAIAWADYDQDGDIDLTEGGIDSKQLFSTARIYNNSTCNSQPCNPYLPFQTSQVSCTNPPFTDTNLINSTLPVPFLTAFAWGDANNDGYLELAMSFENRRNIVFFLAKKENGDTSFAPNWLSNTNYPSTGVAWGDADGDGDLDLAFSGRGGYNTIYYNHYNNTKQLLPNQPTTVAIERPGSTDTAYFYSVGKDFVSGATVPTVTIKYRIFDVDGDGVVKTTFDYSLNGGTIWLPATPIYTPTYSVVSSLLGKPLTFQWDAQHDQAISDNALFRITAYSSLGSDSTAAYRYGFAQHATSVAISPPFRVRGTTCVWPENLTITWYNTQGVERPTNLTTNDTVEFQARVATASRGLTFEWDFGEDATSIKGQVIRRKFSAAKSYPITVRVTSEACPISKSVTNDQENIFITGGRLAYLPILRHVTIGSPTPTPTVISSKKPNLTSRFSLEPQQPRAGQPVIITVYVTNKGEASTTSPFYVDFYINPSTSPRTAIPWYEQQHDSGGLEWYIDQPLAPDETIALTSVPSDNPLRPNPSSFSQWSGHFSTLPVTLYSYVDSDGRGNPNGTVIESNEYDNSSSPLVLTPRSLMAQSATALPQVTDLSGQNSPTAITLTWSAVANGITGYHLYRLGLSQTGPFQRLATLSATATSYTDSAATCGQMYYLTTFNDLGESDASITSYFSFPCP